MSKKTSDLETVYRAIEQAGSIENYVQTQLKERGFLIPRKATDKMSQRELTQYKKQLKEEAAKKRELKQQAWKAYQTKHIIHLGEGVYWCDGYDLDKWDLEHAEERAAENELPPLDNPQQLAAALGLTIADLRWLAFHRDAARRLHYYRFTIPKRDGSPRAIWAPLPRLKKVQRWILHHVVERLLVHGAAHGFLAGRSILTNAAVHCDSQLMLQMDVKDFFPTVTLPRVKGVFRRAGYREQIATLLALLCTEAPREIVEHEGQKVYVSLGPRCLPQGAPTSPALTNVLCLKMDRRLLALARKYGWRYTRYADDLTFSLPAGRPGPSHLGALMGLVKRVVADEGFRIHPDKTRVSRPGGRQTVTGLVVNGAATPRVPRSARRQLRAAIHNLNQGKPLHAGETTSTLAGHIAFVAMTNPAEARRLQAALPTASTDVEEP